MIGHRLANSQARSDATGITSRDAVWGLAWAVSGGSKSFLRDATREVCMEDEPLDAASSKLPSALPSLSSMSLLALPSVLALVVRVVKCWVAKETLGRS